MSRIWTDEMLETLRHECQDMGYEDTAKHINTKHGTQLTKANVKVGRSNYRIFSNCTGRFPKGSEPWNKGKKYHAGGRSSESWFKAGHTPVNHRPVGSERIDKDGYVMVKVQEPNVWALKHRVVWEEHHGKVPDGHVITFVDQDKTNTDISNLKLISNKQNAVMNKIGLRPDDEELLGLAMGVVDLKMATADAIRNRKDTK